MDPQDYALSPGRHATPGRGRCAMEWVAHLAGEGHTDRPASASRVAGAFARSWNDALAHEPRQRLRPYLSRMIGTADDGRDDERGWWCADWLVRGCLPAALEDAGLADDAERLRSAPPISSPAVAKELMSLVRRVRTDVAEARATARREASRVQRMSDWPLRRDGVRAVARSSGRNAALDAARAAVAAAPPAAARLRLVELAWAAAWDAVWTIAWQGPLRTPDELRAPAFALLDRMLPGEPGEPGEPVAPAPRSRALATARPT